MMGDALVLIPPMLCDARVFGPLTAALSPHRPVCIMPVTGADRIEEIATQLLAAAPPQFALLGMAMGGAVALEMMRQAPARVLRIAMMASTSQADTPQTAAAREPLIVAARSGRFADVVSQEAANVSLAQGPRRAAVRDLLEVMGRAIGPEAYVAQARAMQRRRDQSATLRQIRQPMSFICGAQDTVYPVRRHQFMSELVSRSRLSVIPDAGHMPILENPQPTIDAVRDWLN